MSFNDFKEAIQQNIAKMETTGLFVADVDKDLLWETYLESFAPGMNPMYKERTEHDCNCCKQFIRNIGAVVTVALENTRQNIWDVKGLDEQYQPVADALAELVRSRPIADVYRSPSANVGTSHNHQVVEGAAPIRWDHFSTTLTRTHVMPEHHIPSFLGEQRTHRNVARRSFKELTLEAAEIVLELIEQGSLYRGEEHKRTVESFIEGKKAFDSAKSRQDAFCWKHAQQRGPLARYRSTVIGTLLADISDGMPLDKAVRSFESKVAPHNYKRSSALITQGMIKKAQAKVAELGIEGALQRRYAQIDDLTINNVLFADRSAQQAMGVFDELFAGTASGVPNLDRVEEVPVETFLRDVMPKATKLEAMFENRLEGNLVSLIAPADRSAPNILKWDNNFSWSYKGDVTDSIKERVKRAGGDVTGELRCSLSWFNSDDLDIHVHGPNGEHIFYSQRRGASGGCLDVDMNINAGGSNYDAVAPVENVTWSKLSCMTPGSYTVEVYNYTKRNTERVGFDVEIELLGKTITFRYPKTVRQGERVTVANIEVDQNKKVIVKGVIDSTEQVKDVWGIKTQTFVPVRTALLSPNHWDGNETGNKHYFFMLEGCANPGKSRGLYNEFLDGCLHEHRKVFEVLGAKMKAPESANQLSGLGFSSTLRKQAIFRVTGSSSRVIKVNF